MEDGDRQSGDRDRRVATSEPELVVDVAGFEGPLDLLLHLARRQKVDLSRISILALTKQYLRFIEGARALRLELAADYLVMAAWLAFLKSKLFLPHKPSAEAESGETMAAALQFRLRRLEAMREAAHRLVNGRQLGRDVFRRGMPQDVAVERRTAFSASLHDLLTAYAARRQRMSATSMRVAERGVMSLAEAREMLERLLGGAGEWTSLDRFLREYLTGPAAQGADATASSFAACLELVREGRLEMQQDKAFAPLLLRARLPAKPSPRLLP